jgi:enoyl-CoA hydratase/carnithine racemase
MQTPQADYFAAYRYLKLSRDDKGVLVAEFHSDGGQFIMTAQSHTEFVDAFHRIGQDRANKIVIITGAGGNFIADVDGHRSEMSPIRASGAEFMTKASRF